MIAINAPSIASAWERAVRHVLAKGVPVTTEDGEETLETDEMIVKVDDPFYYIYDIPKNSPYRRQMLDAYAEQLIKGTGNAFDYNYHDRLFRYHVNWDDDTDVIDQIVAVTNRLNDSLKTRRAIALVWNANDDAENYWESVPCLQWIQFLVRDNKLQMKVLFRSNDVLLAMHANMYALVHLQQYVATALGLPVGSYTHIVTVPHIYYKRDANEVKKWSSTSA